MRDIHVGTIPYFLYLASLSDLISRALLKDVLQFIDLEIACKIFSTLYSNSTITL
jgi:hypothetical protein